jgi:SET domain-containing protein
VSPDSVFPLEKRRSARHGLGVFAAGSIPRHALVIEYAGELIPHAEATRRYPEAGHEDAPEHTYVLELDAERVIDANVGGNDARFINHSCAPNLEPIAIGDQMWLVALRDIAPDEELGYDYAIELDERHTAALKRRWPCRCGAATCRGTLLRPKRAPVPADVREARAVIARRLRALLADA